MTKRVKVGGLQIAEALHDLVAHEITPGLNISAETFWQELGNCLVKMELLDEALLEKRTQLQAKIDTWHQQHAGQAHDPVAYRAFLQEIGYLLPEGDDFNITTRNADPEISQIAGPQLVVPVMNARYALNAANARWGSLYDSLYGTDVIPETDGAEIRKDYNPIRAAHRAVFSGTTPFVVQGWWPMPWTFWMKFFPCSRAVIVMSANMQLRITGLSSLEVMNPPAYPTRASLSVTPATRMIQPAFCCVIMACMWTCSSIDNIQSARPTRPVSRMWSWKPR